MPNLLQETSNQSNKPMPAANLPVKPSRRYEKNTDGFEKVHQEGVLSLPSIEPTDHLAN
jgi:hypothetical protein